METAEFCSICLGTFNYPKGILPCQHEFCYDCLRQWAATKNNCPVGRQPFSEIKIVHNDGRDEEIIPAPNPADDEIIQWQEADAVAMDFEAYIENIVCDRCQSGDNEDILLLCDACNLGFHTYCLASPLAGVPDGEWFCDNCSVHLFHDHHSETEADYPADAELPKEETETSIHVN